MKKFFLRLNEVFRKGDMLLLALCVVTTIFGIVMIWSAKAYDGGTREIIVQTASLAAGIVIYLGMTAFDIDILAGQRTLLFIFNIGFIGMLLIWGVEGDTGNRSWLHFPGLPFNVQPAEVCKLTYIIILAKTMSMHQTRLSSTKNVGLLGFYMVSMVGWYVLISHDTGVALIFIAILLVMAYVGGVSGWWFLGGAVGLAAVGPFIWSHLIRGDQKNRILALIDPSIDPNGTGVLWQTNQSIKALRNGGLSGMGLLKGTLTRAGELPAQHTDTIFCSIGEQLGLIGCLVTLIMLIAIVVRVIYVGMKSPDYMNRMICLGTAAMLLFQIIINVGMCIGLLPVIGLALPFVSYGGSSIITSFIAMGIVSGIRMRPARDTSAHYIRPY